MLTPFLFLALSALSPSAVRAPADAPRTIQCTAKNTAEGKDRKCHLKLPKGTAVRSCDAAEKAAGHCTLDARVVAWTSGENGARCELSKKKTDWKKKVTMKVAKETRPGAGSCTLFVSVQ